MTEEVKDQEVVTEEPIVPVEEEDEDDTISDFRKYLNDDEDEDDEEEVDEELEEVEEEVVEEVVKEIPDRMFTQAEVNQLLGSSRIQGRELVDKVGVLQQMTGGMNLDQIITHLRTQEVDKYEQEYGMPRNEAERVAEDRQVRTYLEEQLQQLFAQQKMTQYTAAYNNDKARFLANPLVKKYEAEIDAVSQGGQQLGFEAAMNYVIGQKAVAGEILQNVKDSVQQQTLRNVNKRPTVTPEGSGGGSPQTKSIPPDLRKMAAVFGNDPKDVAKEYNRLQRKK